MTIKITQLGNLTGVYGNTIVPVVANIAGDWTTVKGNLTQISAYTNLAELPYGNIIPAADAVYSLGTPSYRFKDLYLLGSTIYLGNATISVSNAAVVTSLPLTAPSVTVGNTSISSTGNITANTLSAGALTTNSMAVSGNTISLGSATLDVSSGSLESSVPISAPLTSTSNLTIQGAAIDFAQGSYIEESEVAGMVGTYGLALNSPDDGIVGLNALDVNAAVTSSVIVSNVSVQLNVANVDPVSGNINVWLFDSVGGVFFPDGTRQDTAGYVAGGNIFVANTYTPSLSNSAGTTGQLAYDSTHIYICVATDTWKRANISTW